MSALTLSPVIGEADWINRTFFDIDEIGEKDIDSQVNQVLECIVLEGLQHTLSVDRLHKHYDLLDGELPTYTAVNGDFKKLVIKPLPVNSASFPLCFAVADAGLVATSVLDTACVPEVLRSRMHAILGDKSDSFVKVVRLIQSLHMEAYIGLSFRIDNFTERPTELHYDEISYLNRVQTLTACERISDPIAGRYVHTSWFTSCSREGLTANGPIVRGCQKWGCHNTCNDGHHGSHSYTSD
jgi:hypothetical protein